MTRLTCIQLLDLMITIQYNGYLIFDENDRMQSSMQGGAWKVTTTMANYFKIMPFFARKRVCTLFCLKIVLLFFIIHTPCGNI